MAKRKDSISLDKMKKFYNAGIAGSKSPIGQQVTRGK